MSHDYAENCMSPGFIRICLHKLSFLGNSVAWHNLNSVLAAASRESQEKLSVCLETRSQDAFTLQALGNLKIQSTHLVFMFLIIRKVH